MTAYKILLWCLCACALFCIATPLAQAHPDDEFCLPGGGMDPALCRSLQALDRSGDMATESLAATIDLDRTAFETLQLYVKIGAQHILPGGWDHILFVLAFCFATLTLRNLLLQVSLFTLAHTATLGMVAAGIFAPDPAWVEPLIAITIAILAIEILFFPMLTRWRIGLIFVFGLIHGMGFAGFFGTLGLPETHFWSALIGFNIGVEVGQITVIAIALTALWPLRRGLSENRFHHYVAVPACCLIALMATYWTIERVFGF